MNRALLNPFCLSDLPTGIEEILPPSPAVTAQFNRHGNLLAVGGFEGLLTLFDFDARSVAASFTVYPPCPVSCIAFLYPGNASAAIVGYSDGMIRLYDTLRKRLVMELKFPKAISQISNVGRQTDMVVVVLDGVIPIVVYLREGKYEVTQEQLERIGEVGRTVEARKVGEGMREENRKRKVTTGFGNKVICTVPKAGTSGLLLTGLVSEEDVRGGNSKSTNSGRRKSATKYCVTSTRKGEILRGGKSGIVQVFSVKRPQNPATYEEGIGKLRGVAFAQMPGKAVIRSITLDPKERNVLINSYDRSMRLFPSQKLLSVQGNLGIIEPKVTFTEIVNRTQVVCACFSNNGEYVLGGIEGSDHKILVWRADDGHLVLTLEGDEGARESVRELAWHPLKGVLISVGGSQGRLYVWAKNVTENWSAFATEFSELDGNEEYVEKETEFDAKEPEDLDARRSAREAAEKAPVDVVTVNDSWFSDDSSDEDCYFFIPAEPVRDDLKPGSTSDLLMMTRENIINRPPSPGDEPKKRSREENRRRITDDPNPRRGKKSRSARRGNSSSQGGRRVRSNSPIIPTVLSD